MIVPLLLPPAAFDAFADAELWMTSSTLTSATVCAEGRANGPGTWTLAVAGPVPKTEQISAASFGPLCRVVSTGGLPSGTADVTLVFVTAGGSHAQPIGDCSLSLAWLPGEPPRPLVSACTEPPTVRSDH